MARDRPDALPRNGLKRPRARRRWRLLAHSRAGGRRMGRPLHHHQTHQSSQPGRRAGHMARDPVLQPTHVAQRAYHDDRYHAQDARRHDVGLGTVLQLVRRW